MQTALIEKIANKIVSVENMGNHLASALYNEKLKQYYVGTETLCGMDLVENEDKWKVADMRKKGAFTDEECLNYSFIKKHRICPKCAIALSKLEGTGKEYSLFLDSSSDQPSLFR